MYCSLLIKFTKLVRPSRPISYVVQISLSSPFFSLSTFCCVHSALVISPFFYFSLSLLSSMEWQGSALTPGWRRWLRSLARAWPVAAAAMPARARQNGGGGRALPSCARLAGGGGGTACLLAPGGWRRRGPAPARPRDGLLCPSALATVKKQWDGGGAPSGWGCEVAPAHLRGGEARESRVRVPARRGGDCSRACGLWRCRPTILVSSSRLSRQWLC